MTANLPIARREVLRGTFAGAALLTLPASLRAAPTLDASHRLPAVTELVDGFVTSRKLPGVAAALGFGRDPVELIARGNLSFDRSAPVDLDSLFRVYSMTKPITGMAAMILIDEGKLRLDQPVADFIPEFAHLRVAIDPAKSLESRPAQTTLTVRHLLTHSGGLGYGGIDRGPIGDELRRQGLIPLRVSHRPEPLTASPLPTPPLAEFARRMAQVPLWSEPGTQWHYSVGLDILGLVIERAGKTPSFGHFLQDRLFDPLGMADTMFTVPPAKLARLATNYAIVGGEARVFDAPGDSIFAERPPFAFGGAGLVSSPRDYDRFLAMVLGDGVGLNGRRVMPESAVRLGTSNLLPPTVDTAASLIAGHGFGAGGRVGLGAEAGIYGWAGAAGTVGFVSRRASLRAGLFCQFMPSNIWPTNTLFPDAVRKDVLAMAHAKSA